MAYHRTQILVDPDVWRELVEEARARKRSVSDLVREVLREWMEHRREERHRRLQALDSLDALRRELEQEYGVYEGDIVAEVRAERERQIDRVLLGGEDE